jgi:RNA polymerase sigma factor, sigma-70 family/RNA polymerase sigma-70 factor, Bacteroides expansion family 1
MSIYEKLSDDLLFDLLSDGDTVAFTELYSRYCPLLLIHAVKMLKDQDAAEDVVQEVFCNFWDKSTDNLEVKKSVASYLYTSLRNRIINAIQKNKTRNDHLEQLRFLLDSSIDPVSNSIEFKELSQLIEMEVEKLPKKMRKIFLLSRNSYMSYREIAKTLDISEGTVKKQIHNALKLLKNKLMYSFFFLIMKLIWIIYL